MLSGSLANYSDAAHHLRYNASSIGENDEPSRLYASKRAVARSSQPLNAAGSARKMANNSSLLDHSAKSIRRKYAGGEDRDWKARRRISEQTRMNDVTGLLEQVDMLEVRKNEYLALKQKYTGKDSGLANLVKREAENIQKQRERIKNEL